MVASYFAQPGTTIRTEQHNPPFEDIGAALSQVLIRDGRAPMTGALNMNGNAINNIAPGSSPSSVATLAQAMPIGAVVDFAGSTAPAGWLLCYGQTVSRTTYADLFAVIGTTYGVGNGSTSFNLPDCRGRVIAGLDNMGGTTANRLSSSFSSGVLGAFGGSQFCALEAAQVPSHVHGGSTDASSHFHRYEFPNFTGTTTGGGSFGVQVYANSTQQPTTTSASISQTFTTNGGVGLSGGDHPNVQPTIVMNKIIKASYNG